MSVKKKLKIKILQIKNITKLGTIVIIEVHRSAAHSGVVRPEVVGVCRLIYQRWQLHHVTLIKWVNITASIRTTHRCSFHKV